MKTWKYIKIFVSSTFLDMDYERDILKNIVEPKLNEYLKDYCASIEFTDLRHSVKSDSKDSVLEREKKIFNICLEEIDNCRPYFMGILGHRYGWIPARDGLPLPDVTLPEGFPINQHNLSVTMFEFLHGFLSPLIPDGHSIVFIRDESSYEGLGNVEIEQYIENNRFIKSVKDYIRFSDYSFNVVDYTIKLNSSDNTSRLEWADFVISHIKELIQDELVVDERSEEEVYVQAQERYVQNHIRNFKGRNHELDECMELLDDPTGEFIVAAGQRGLGLTSFFCKLYDRIRENRKNICLLYCDDSETTYTSDDAIYLWLLQLNSYLEHDYKSQIISAKNNLNSLADIWLEIIPKVKEKGYDVIVFCETFRFYERYPKMSVSDIFAISTAYYSAEISHLESWMYYIKPFDEATVRHVTNEMRPEIVSHLLLKKSVWNAKWLDYAISIINNLYKHDFIAIRNRADEDNERKIINYQLDIIKDIPDDYDAIVPFLIDRLKSFFNTDLIDNYLFLMCLNPEGWSDALICQILDCDPVELITLRQMLGTRIIRKSNSGLWELSSPEIKDSLSKKYELKFFKHSLSKAFDLVTNLPPELPEYQNMAFRLGMMNDNLEFCIFFIERHKCNDMHTLHYAIDAFSWYAKFYKLDFYRFVSGLLSRKHMLSYDFYKNFLSWINTLNRADIKQEYLICLERLVSSLRTLWINKAIDLQTYSVAALAMTCQTKFYGETNDYDTWVKHINLGISVSEEYYAQNSGFMGAFLFFIHQKFLSLKNNGNISDSEVYSWLESAFIRHELSGKLQFGRNTDKSAYARLLFDISEFMSMTRQDDYADEFCMKSFEILLELLDYPTEVLENLDQEPKEIKQNLLLNLIVAQKLHFHYGLLQNKELQEISLRIFSVCDDLSHALNENICYSSYHRAKAAYCFMLDITDEEKIGYLMDIANRLVSRREKTTYWKNHFYIRENSARNIDATYNAWLYSMALAMYVLCDKPCGTVQYDDKGWIKEESNRMDFIVFDFQVMMIRMTLIMKNSPKGIPMPQLWDSLIILYESIMFHEMTKEHIDVQKLIKLYNSISDIVEEMSCKGVIYPMLQFQKNIEEFETYINSCLEDESAGTLDLNARYLCEESIAESEVNESKAFNPFL